MLRPSRQMLLFVIAIGGPCVLLVGLTLRMLAQERELIEKRRADERRRLAAEIRQELLSDLMRLRMDALQTHAARAALGDPTTALALIGRVEQDALVLPWNGRAAVTSDTAAPAFLEAIRTGEGQEFVRGEYVKAADSYRTALTSARTVAQRTLAQVLLARVLAKDKRTDQAHRLYRAVLQTPVDVLDDQGIPFALYAARRLIESSEFTDSDATATTHAVKNMIGARRAHSPPSVHMTAGIAAALVERAANDERRSVAIRVREGAESLVRDVEQALAIQSSFPALLARARSVAGGKDDVIWVPHGQSGSVWLIGIEGDTPTVTAFRLASVVASMSTGHSRIADIAVASDGEPLGETFPGLTLRFDAAAIPPSGETLQRAFYMSALLLVLGVAMTGGYFFWRDTRREVRLATMRSQFVSSVSHELRTPLTSIRMFGELLLLGRSANPRVTDEYLQTIVNESERLTRLLDNVLDFSKIEAGRKVYQLRPCSAADIARSAVATMRYQVAQHGFDLQMQIDAAAPQVLGDRDALEQALLNLLSNAMKYSGTGRVIRLRVRAENGRVVIDVSDEGIGIPAAEQLRIFEKFYRVNDPRHACVPGTGLGLTLVSHIVNAHRGEILVQSEVGRGTTFSVVIPTAAGSVRAAGDAQIPA